MKNNFCDVGHHLCAARLPQVGSGKSSGEDADRGNAACPRRHGVMRRVADSYRIRRLGLEPPEDRAEEIGMRLAALDIRSAGHFLAQ